MKTRRNLQRHRRGLLGSRMCKDDMHIAFLLYLFVRSDFLLILIGCLVE